MRHKRDAVRQWSAASLLMEQREWTPAGAAHCCAMVVRTWEEIPSPATRERSVHEPHAESICLNELRQSADTSVFPAPVE